MSSNNFKTKFLPYLWLILGSFLIIFTRTRSFVSIAIFFAPLFLLRFSRSQPKVKGILLTFVGYIIAIQIAQWNLKEIDNLLLFLIFNVRGNLVTALILALPYITDRLFYPRFSGFMKTLIFPTTAVALYYLETLIGPIDSIGIFYAFTQYGNLPLVQLLSLLGIWGMVFFVYWFAAMANWIWENQMEWQIIKKGMIIYGVITVFVLLYGGIKTSSLFFDYSGKTVRVAAVPMPLSAQESDNTMLEILNNRIFSPFESSIQKIEKQVQKAALANAQFAVFQEYSMLIPEEQENDLLEQLKRIARENHIYLCFNYGSMPELEDREHMVFFGIRELSDNEEGRNKSILVNPSGEIEIIYLKTNLASGENTWILEGDGEISVTDTPYGRIGIVICRDMSLPAFMRKAAQQKADIVFAPSYEAVKSLSVTYSQMLRAVEFGFAFVRPCNQGLSIAIDKHGRVLAAMNSFTTKNQIMYADVPVKGTRTLYSYIGDLFAWLCGVSLAVLIIRAIAFRKKAVI
ncbi:MAG: carbon-nitrogen hydrolase family protein [Spirochaetes bacterium]|nr:carbon-nitrogen hydrolase family protein [Spirochaetota bacterium]